MDERVLNIIKAMAMGYLTGDDEGNSCVYCDASDTSGRRRKDIPELDEIYHDGDCPVVHARLVLYEAGTPLKIYKMAGKHNYMTTRQGQQRWRNFTGYTLAISEQDAIKNYFWSTTRDLQASFVREFPLD